MAESSRFEGQPVEVLLRLLSGGPATVRLVTGEPGPAAPTAGEQATRMFYLLTCLQCGDPDHPLVMPFSSPAERGQWAAEHTRGTGHSRWTVKDEPRPVVQGAVVADAGELEAGR